MKYLNKKTLTALLLSTMMLSTANAQTGGTNVPITTDYYTFELSDNVNRSTVIYKNRYGITLNADLYLPKNMDLSQKHPALVVGPPYGGVKEQGPGVYANQLAQRGFVVLAFDPSFNGESGGSPHHTSSPDIFVEDFSAGVDYLGSLAYVDREKIGAIGICGSGGFAISAAQVDMRIKAVATTSMYDISRGDRYGFNDSFTVEQRNNLFQELSQQRWVDFEKGGAERREGGFPLVAVDAVPAGMDPISAEFFTYYGLKRGHHPNSRGGFTAVSSLSFANFPLLNYIETISPRPILFIIGDTAHSRYFSEDAYAAAAEPKELYVVSNSNHIDLYDQIDKIPFDKLESFFKNAF